MSHKFQVLANSLLVSGEEDCFPFKRQFNKKRVHQRHFHAAADIDAPSILNQHLFIFHIPYSGYTSPVYNTSGCTESGKTRSFQK